MRAANNNTKSTRISIQFFKKSSKSSFKKQFPQNITVDPSEVLIEDTAFFRQTVFSDEGHFWFNGYINKQNPRIWDEVQPEQFQELSFHPEKATVWCGCGFKNYSCENLIFIGDRYRTMITDYLMPEMEVRDLGDISIQQEGATSNTSHQSVDLLIEHFGEQIISRFGPVDWYQDRVITHR